MALITNIKYRGNIIATLGEGETKTLATSLKICDSDIVVEVVDNLITFTVDGTSYNAEDGQTWMQWVLTDYNTDGFYLEEDTNTLFTADDKEILYNGNGISGTYEIIANGVYTIAPSEVVISAGTYVAKLNPTYTMDFNQALSFGPYTTLRVDSSYIRYDTYPVYSFGSSSWDDPDYQTITISTDQTVSEEFAEWFNANYTKQVAQIQLTGASSGLLILPDSWIGKTWSSLIGENIGNWELGPRSIGVELSAGIWSGRIMLNGVSVQQKETVSITTYTCEIEN